MFQRLIDKLPEKEGTVAFKLDISAVLKQFEGKERLILFEAITNKTIFYIDCFEQNIRFIQSNPNYNTKVAEFNLTDINGFSYSKLIVNWSKKFNNFYIEDLDSNKVIHKKSRSVKWKFKSDINGNIIQIGSDNAEVKMVEIISNGEIELQPSAKEILDHQFEKIEVMISNSKLTDYSFELTMIQQVLVMLATTFEVYSQARFQELSEERLIDLNHLYSLLPNKYRQQHFETNNKKFEENADLHLKWFIEQKKINFQNWDECKKAYACVYNIKFSDLNVDNSILVNINKVMKARHVIIHSRKDISTLNYDDVHSQNPIFINQDLGKSLKQNFKSFLYKLHETSL